MIETFFGADALATPAAFFLAFVIGLGFGGSLEQAGFGSSRRLCGIFYFRDMTVLKVMFTAVITAMLGMGYLLGFGLIKPESISFPDTILGAQIVGGLLFGLGFVIGGWCPGTAAVGLAGGRLDALLFLIGGMLGSGLYNELFPLVRALATGGNRGLVFVYDSLGIPRPLFAFGFTLTAIVCFWGAEFIEQWRGNGKLRERLGSLLLLSFGFLVAAGGLFLPLSGPTMPSPANQPVSAGAAPAAVMDLQPLLQAIEQADDHLEPEELADRLMANEPGLTLIDIRSPEEFNRAHIRNAIHIPLSELPEKIRSLKNTETLVLYSNGMTHPAQALTVLRQAGFNNVFLLTDGFNGFINRCLKPVSLRGEPVSPDMKDKINLWRSFFLAGASQPGKASKRENPELVAPPGSIPGLIEPDWLSGHLEKPGLVVIDPRPQPEYNSGHVPGAVSLNPESLRGVVQGVPSMLLPVDLLARQFSLLGLSPDDLVILTYGEKPHDATLIALALERLGHRRYAVLQGGNARWTQEKRPLSQALPAVQPAEYPVSTAPDRFTVSFREVQSAMLASQGVILDVRPHDAFSGKKQEEARGGHIPGAVNRPYTEDVTKQGDVSLLKSAADLAKSYASVIPNRDTPVIVHCRTGHQASQAYFILKHLLGYNNVTWYDGGWTEWAARPELPVIANP